MLLVKIAKFQTSLGLITRFIESSIYPDSEKMKYALRLSINSPWKYRDFSTPCILTQLGSTLIGSSWSTCFPNLTEVRLQSNVLKIKNCLCFIVLVMCLLLNKQPFFLRTFTAYHGHPGRIITITTVLCVFQEFWYQVFVTVFSLGIEVKSSSYQPLTSPFGD